MADSAQTNQGAYNSISSSIIQPQPKMVLPPTRTDMTPYASIIDGALTSMPNLDIQIGTAQKTQDSLLSGIAGTSSDLLGKEGYSQAQQDLQGVRDKQAQLDALNADLGDLSAQMKGLVRNSQAIPLKVQQNNLGTGATDAGVAPQEAGMLRENAIKALTLASQGDIISSQITAGETRLTRAKENAQKAVDLKYKPMEDQLKYMKDMLDINQKYILDPAEKKKADATATLVKERDRLLAEQKADEKSNTDLIINASSQMAPASVIANAKAMIAKGAKPMEVASALGVYSGDYIGNQSKLQDMKLKDLEYKIKNNDFIQSQTPAMATNADGSIVRGSGASSTDRNKNTLETIITKNGKKIPDGAQTLVGATLGVLDTIKQYVDANPKGEFEGQYPMSGAVPDTFKSTQRVNNEGLLAAMNLKAQMWASGASLTNAQTEKVLQMVPSPSDTDRVVKQKLNTLSDMMTGQTSAILSSAGVKYRPEKASYYDNSIGTKVKNSIGSGYSTTEVVNGLASDPVYGPKIAQAKQANWSDDQIALYLQSLTEQVETPEQIQQKKQKDALLTGRFGN